MILNVIFKIRKYLIVLTIIVFYVFASKYLDFNKIFIFFRYNFRDVYFIGLDIKWWATLSFVFLFVIPPLDRSLCFLVGSLLNVFLKKYKLVSEQFLRNNFYESIETFAQMFVYVGILIWTVLTNEIYFPEIDKMPATHIYKEFVKGIIYILPLLLPSYLLRRFYQLIDNFYAGKTIRLKITTLSIYESGTKIFNYLLPILYAFSACGGFGLYGDMIILMLSSILTINWFILGILYILVKDTELKNKIYELSNFPLLTLLLIHVYSIPIFKDFLVPSKKFYSDFFLPFLLACLWGNLTGYKNFFLRTKSRKLEQLHYYAFLGSIFSLSLLLTIKFSLKIWSAQPHISILDANNLYFLILSTISFIYCIYFLAKKYYFDFEIGLQSLILSIVMIAFCLTAWGSTPEKSLIILFLTIGFCIFTISLISLRSINTYLTFLLRCALSTVTIFMILNHLGWFTFDEFGRLLKDKFSELIFTIIASFLLFFVSPYFELLSKPEKVTKDKKRNRNKGRR